MARAISATIAGSAKGRAAYDQALEAFSRPFMQAYVDGYRFGPQRTCPDGVESNFEFLQTEDAQQRNRGSPLVSVRHVHNQVG